MSPFSTVFHAIHRAGGINDIGTLRNVQVLRNGKKIAGVDIYEYLFDGKTSGNIRLQEGDVIIVPPYETLVNINGNVKRPMYYEVKPNENINTLIEYAGGFTGDAYTDNVRVARQSGSENELYNIGQGDFATYYLQDGDIVTVGSILDRYTNRVELKGSVYRPGMFAISKDLQTVSQLISQADGVMDDAYLDRALLYREGPNLELQVIALDLGGILNGTADDVELKRNDVIMISSIHELQERGAFTIGGMVARPGTYPYAEHFTLQDLIFQAGGLLEGASTARVDISRRIVDPTSTKQTEQISTVFSVSIEGGLAVGNGESLILQPYDMVQVRRSPGYVAQETVTVGGEVLFEGSYTLQKRNERVSDIVRRAGGIVDGAYVKGAYLTRRMSDDEFNARKTALQLALSNSQAGMGDSISVSKLDLSPNYNVGINLAKALANPGSHYDVILEPGDRLFVPQEQSTVKIAGDVLYPNTVLYEPNKKLKDYIDQAGGYGQRAKKNSIYIVYMNGTVEKAKRGTVIEPGCQIIVPSKPHKGTNWPKILSIATSFSSVATMAAAIANMSRR
ncbi:MAG: SLBB domain-containing protein [Muribaculaceae bacterium]|nr:SLBB domain-containing protein [Muribaculaceae bacterium]